MLSLSLPKLLDSRHARDERALLSRSELTGRLTRSELKVDSAERRLVDAEREIARLEGMRINVAALKPILKLGLLEVETNLTDFQYRVLGDEREEVWWRNGYRHAYLGALQIPVKAQLGIDLHKVKVWQSPDGQVVVSGIVMTSITDTSQGAHWLLDEVRTEYLKGKQIVKFKGDVHDKRAKAYSREQEAQVRRRLQDGQEFKVFESGLIRTAEQLLRVLLAPLGRDVVFEAEPRPESKDLIAYLGEYNQNIERRIHQLKAPQ